MTTSTRTFDKALDALSGSWKWEYAKPKTVCSLVRESFTEDEWGEILACFDRIPQVLVKEKLEDWTWHSACYCKDAVKYVHLEFALWRKFHDISIWIDVGGHAGFEELNGGRMSALTVALKKGTYPFDANICDTDPGTVLNVNYKDNLETVHSRSPRNTANPP